MSAATTLAPDPRSTEQFGPDPYSGDVAASRSAVSWGARMCQWDLEKDRSGNLNLVAIQLR